MTKTRKDPTGGYNPFFGCAILVIVICTFGGIVGWVLYSGYRQDKEIGMFTVDNAEPLPSPALSPNLKATLVTKLITFGESARANQPASLSLTWEELNALLEIAAEFEVADYRGIVAFTGIDGAKKELLADLRWPMNRLSLSDKSKRFLVGEGGFKPVIENGSFDLKIDTLSVPGKEVSYGFLRNLQTWPWLNLAKLKPQIAETMKKVTSWDIPADGSVLVIEAKPGAPAEGTK